MSSRTSAPCVMLLQCVLWMQYLMRLKIPPLMGRGVLLSIASEVSVISKEMQPREE